MAALTRAASPLRGSLGSLRLVGTAVLRAYAHLIFARSLGVGLLLMLATAMAPRALAGGLLGVLLALGTARLLEIERETVLDGSYGISALLLGLGVAQTMGLGAVGLGLLAFFAPLSAVLVASLRSALLPLNLPALSLPFLGAFYLLLGLVGVTLWPMQAPVEDAYRFLPESVALLLRSVGALFFLPRVDAGALIVLALAWHSRISTLLAMLACGMALLLRESLPIFADPILFHSLVYNSVFTAVGLGGVWFVPSLASFVLALGGTLLCALITLGVLGPLARLGLPILIVPFNLTVLLLLLALRQRALDRRPKSVDFPAGTPEQNLAYFRTRLLRFERRYPVRFLLPVRGAWTCTQGVDGHHTHKGLWRHAYDFEVLGLDGHPVMPSVNPDEAPTLLSCHAYRLPVLATAAGTVVKVIGSVPDNELGAVNLAENWGNLVVLYHAQGVYSMVAHLAAGSVKVVEGQAVRAGEVLGLCGNSGRSAQPHVHFQLQSGPKVGDPTLPCWFSDAVQVAAFATDKSGPHADRVVRALSPQTGETVRNLEPEAERATFFQFPYGVVWALRSGEVSEHITCDIDFYGHFALRSREHAASLFYSLDGDFFTAYDLLGAPDSLLHLVRAGLSRVPLDGSEALRWTDFLPARMFRGRILGTLLDFVSPFLLRDGIELEFRAERRGPALVVSGESLKKDRSGAPIIRTRAELVPYEGLVRLEVTRRGRTVTVERIRDLAETQDPVRGAP